MSLRHLLAASAFLAATGLPALAQQGLIPSRSLTCAQLQALVQRQGRVLISTAPHSAPNTAMSASCLVVNFMRLPRVG